MFSRFQSYSLLSHTSQGRHFILPFIKIPNNFSVLNFCWTLSLYFLRTVCHNYHKLFQNENNQFRSPIFLCKRWIFSPIYIILHLPVMNFIFFVITWSISQDFSSVAHSGLFLLSWKTHLSLFQVVYEYVENHRSYHRSSWNSTGHFPTQ